MRKEKYSHQEFVFCWGRHIMSSLTLENKHASVHWEQAKEHTGKYEESVSAIVKGRVITVECAPDQLLLPLSVDMSWNGWYLSNNTVWSVQFEIKFTFDMLGRIVASSWKGKENSMTQMDRKAVK